MSSMANRRFYEFGRFRLDATGRILFREGQMVPLPPKIADTLLVLVENAGEVVGKEELLKKVWPDTFVGESNLTRTISILRNALADRTDRRREYVVTIPKRGYRFVAPVKYTSAQQIPSPTGNVMLAVLPFQNLSGDSRQEYFSDGLTEEMITQLGRLNPKRLGVIARTSAMQYKSAGKSILEIGKELGVSFILEGSVRRAGHRVRIAAQLIQVRDQTHLWAESYERDLSDILVLQNSVASAIAKEIEIKVAPHERAHLAGAQAVKPEAYDAYLRGRFFWNKRTKVALGKSISYFEQAIEQDPNYAPAYAGLADSYYLLMHTGYGALPPKRAFPKAKTAALEALRIDETNAEAHTSLGNLSCYEFDWFAAGEEFRRSIELDPSYATGHHWYALYLCATGRFADALVEAKCACGLDPLSVITNRDLGLIFYYAHQPDLAIEQCRKTLELDPDFALTHQVLGRAYLEKGMYDEAVAAIQRAVRLSGSAVAMWAALGHAYALAGKTVKARTILRDLAERSKRSYVAPTSIATVYSGLGETNRALQWLEKAYKVRDPGLLTLKVHPIFESLRPDPRFQSLLQRLGLGA